MLGWGRGAWLGACATLAAWLAVGPGPAHAGTYGDLDLRWTATTTNWTEYPDRDSQQTYQPCNGSERLVGIGAWVIESAPTFPSLSEFKAGRAYIASVHPSDQINGVPVPDSNRETADHLFKSDRDLVMGESTLCAETAEPAYEKETFTAEGNGRSVEEVKCTGGAHVTSGGAKAPGPLKSTRVVESAPIDGGDADAERDDGWRVAIDNLKRKDRRAEVHALCSGADGFSYEAQSFKGIPEARTHADAQCPGGQWAFGGGINHDIPFRKATIVATRHGQGPMPDDWIAELDNLTGQAAAAKVFVVCHS